MHVCAHTHLYSQISSWVNRGLQMNLIFLLNSYSLQNSLSLNLWALVSKINKHQAAVLSGYSCLTIGWKSAPSKKKNQQPFPFILALEFYSDLAVFSLSHQASAFMSLACPFFTFLSCSLFAMLCWSHEQHQDGHTAEFYSLCFPLTNVQGFTTLRPNETKIETNPGFALPNPKLASSAFSLHLLWDKEYFCFCHKKTTFG